MSIKLPDMGGIGRLQTSQPTPFSIGGQQGGLLVDQQGRFAGATSPQQAAIMENIDAHRISAERSSKDNNFYTPEELRIIAKRIGLKTAGTKADLAGRILAYLNTITRQ